MDLTTVDRTRLFDAWKKEAALDVVFQPLVHIPSGRAFGYEALSRPRLEGVPIPIVTLLESASLSGQLSDFDRIALPLILRAAQDQGLKPEDRLFVNCSPFSLLEPQILHQLASPGATIRPSQLVIEISEREELPGLNLTELFEPYRRLGIRIALDDFGAGYSGLNRVVDLDPDYAKIDLGLVRNIDKNPVKYALVESTVQFASRSGHLAVLAEGVETEAELVTLSHLGVTLAQGFLLGRPAATLATQNAPRPVELLTRRLPDPREVLQALITTTQRLLDGVGYGQGLTNHVVHLASRLLGCDFAAIYIPQGDRLVLEAAFPAAPDEAREVPWRPQSIGYRVLARRQTLIFQTAQEYAQSPVAASLGIQSLMLVPVSDSTQSRALLAIGFHQPFEVRPQDIQMAEGLARLMALVTSASGSVPGSAGVGEPVFEAISSLMDSEDLDSLLARIMEAALSVSGGHLGYIGVVSGPIVHAVSADRQAFDMAQHDIESLDTDLGRGPVGRCLREGRMIVIQDIAADPTLDPWRSEMINDGIHAALAIPLIESTRVVGLLKVYHSQKNGFDPGRIRRLQALASLATAVIAKWQEEHLESSRWLNQRSAAVLGLIGDLTVSPSGKAALARIKEGVRDLVGGRLAGVVRFQADRPVLDDVPGEFAVPVTQALLSAYEKTCIALQPVDGEVVVALPLLARGGVVGAIWALAPDLNHQVWEPLASLLTPHLKALSIAGAASLLLGDYEA